MQLKPYYEKVVNLPVRGQFKYRSTEEANKKGRARAQSHKSALMLFLMIFSGGEKRWRQLAANFNLNKDTVWRTFKWVLWCLSEVLYNEIQWPDATEREELCVKLAGFIGCFGHVDGTRVRTRRPKKGQRLFYSGKTGFHSLNYQVVVDIYGRYVLSCEVVLHVTQFMI